MAILTKIPAYAINVTKSIAYSAADVIKSDMPNTSAFLNDSSNKEVLKVVYDNIKDLQSIKLMGIRARTALKRTKIWEAGDLGVKSIMEDIQTGKWYNKERIDKLNEDIIGMDDDDSWGDMDISSMDFGDESDRPSKGDQLISSSVQVSASQAADQVSEVTVRSAQAMMKQQQQSTQLLYTQNFKLHAELRSTVTNLANKSNTYLANVQNINQTIADNNKKFYDFMTKSMQEQNAMLKESLEMQRNLYKNQAEIEKQREREGKNKKTSYGDLISYDGVLDLKSYGSYIKKNSFKQLDELTGGTLSLLMGDNGMQGNMLNMFAASPAKFLSDFIVSQLIPRNVRKSSRKLDSTIGGIAPTVLGTLNKTARNSDNQLLQTVAKIFGIDTRVNNKIETGKYEKGPMQFNGKANKSLTEVIPELLSDILSTLNGQQKKLYDFDKGKWTTGKAIQREYDSMNKSNRKSAFSDLTSEIRKFINSNKGPKFSSRDNMLMFEESLEKFLNVLYENDGSFHAKRDRDLYTLGGGVNPDDYEMIARMIQNIGKRNHSVRLGLSANVMNSKQTLNNQFKNLQDAGSMFNYLFNGSDIRSYKATKYEEEPIPMGLNLGAIVDNKGNNIFYYLQNMYEEMYRIRTSGFGIRGGVLSGGRNRRPFSGGRDYVSPIANNRKLSNKDRYTESERRANDKYQQMIEEHTRKGGKLFDLVDDKGNLNLINATAEQLNILDIIDEARYTGGWLHDSLYSSNSALDMSNRSKAKRDDGDSKGGINAKKFSDRMKQAKTLEEKYKVLTDMAKRGTRGTSSVVSSAIAQADDAIYNFFYGDEMGEEDENGRTIKGFVGLMKNKLNSSLDKTFGFIDEKVLTPLRKKLGTDDLRDWFLETTGLKSMITGVKEWLLGAENDDTDKGILGAIGGGIFGALGKGLEFVGGAVKTVTAPITDRVKDSWNKLNRSDDNMQEVSIEDYLIGTGQSSAEDISKARLESIVQELRSIPGLGSYYANLLELTPYDLSLLININKFLTGFINGLPRNDAGRMARRRYEELKELLSTFRKMHTRDIKNYSKDKAKAAKNLSPVEEAMRRSRVDRAKRNAEEYERNLDPIQAMIDEIEAIELQGEERAPINAKDSAKRFLGAENDDAKAKREYAKNIAKNLNISKKDANAIIPLIESIMGTNIYSYTSTPVYDKSGKEIGKKTRLTDSGTQKKLYDTKVSELYKMLANSGNDKVADELEKQVMKLGVDDLSIGALITGNIRNKNNEDTFTTNIENITGVVSSTFNRLVDLLESVIDNARGAVRVTTKARPAVDTSPMGAERRIESSARESETEGDSGSEPPPQRELSPEERMAELRKSLSGTGYGGIGSFDYDDYYANGIIRSAHGGVFNRGVTSALSKGEFYERNGLLGKVPSTGVYNIKAGTTIIPTKKDKAIEEAKELDVINKMVYSNADGDNARTRKLNGKVYKEVSPGLWRTYIKDKQGNTFVQELTDDDFRTLGEKVVGRVSSAYNEFTSRTGINSAFGTTSFVMPKNLEEAKAMVKKYSPKLGTGAVIGGAIGLLAGNPILGAAIGGAASVVGASDQAKNFLFGEKAMDEYGNEHRMGGIISKEAQDTFNKFFPSMSKHAVVGSLLGLVTPFGFVGGALMGSAVGWAKTNDAVREALFGKSDDPKSGLMSKETRDKLKKAFPNILLGAAGGALLGPFGFLGNILVGSGIGLASTTSQFKDMIFGTESVAPDGTITRQGGLVDVIKDNIVDPLKDFGNFFKDKMEFLFIDGIINPIKESIKPLTKDFLLLSKALVTGIPRMVDSMFANTFGRPLSQLINDKIISPLSKATFGAAKGIVNIGTGVVSAPFRLLREYAQTRQMSHIGSGNADYMTANERLEFRKDHKIKAGFTDSYKTTDKILSLMNKDELKETLGTMKILKDVGSLRKDERKAGRALSAEITKFFGTKGRVWKTFKSTLQNADLEAFTNLIRTTPMVNGEYMTQAQVDGMVRLAATNLEAIDVAKRKQRIGKHATSQVIDELRTRGFNVNKKNVNKMLSLVEHEYAYKKDTEASASPEEAAVNRSIDIAIKNKDEIVEVIKISAKFLSEMLAKTFGDEDSIKSMRELAATYLDGSEGSDDDKAAREEARKTEIEDLRRQAAEEMANRPVARARGLIGGIKDLYTNRRDIINSSLEEYDLAAQTGGPVSTMAKLIGGAYTRYMPIKDKLDKVTTPGYASDKIKEVYDSSANAFRRFRRGMNGDWLELNGKAQTDADNEEQAAQDDAMFKLGSTIGGVLKKFAFGEDDKEGNHKESFLERLWNKGKEVISFIAKPLKAVGLALLGITGIAGVGHISSNLPNIANIWNEKIAPKLDEKYEGFTTKFNEIKDSILSLPGKIWDYMTGNVDGGGFPSLFANKILPWYMEGLGSFATNFLPPIVAGIIKAVPAIIKGLASGIVKGFNDVFSGKKNVHSDYDAIEIENRADVEEFDQAVGQNIPVAKGTSGFWTKGSTKGSTKINGALGILDKFFGADKKAAELNELEKKYEAATTEEEKAAIRKDVVENASVYDKEGKRYINSEYMLKDKKGNTILEDGTVTNDNSSHTLSLGGATSTQDKIVRTLVKRLFVKDDTPFKAVKALGRGISKLPGGLFTDLIGGGISAAGTVANAPFKLTDRLMVNNMPTLGETMYRLGSTGKLATSAVDDAAAAGFQRLINEGSVDAGIGVLTNSKTGSKFAVEAGESGLKLVKTSTGNKLAQEAAQTGGKGLLGKVEQLMRKGFEKIFNSKLVLGWADNICRMSGKVFNSKLFLAAANSALGKFIQKVAKILQKPTAKIIAKVTGAVSKATPIGVLFHVSDFVTGMMNAKSILGLVNEQDVSWTEMFIAGILKCMNGFILLGLIPETYIVDVLVDSIGPHIGLNFEDLKQRRAEALEIITEFNDEHGSDFKTAEAYNKRNSIGAKIGKAFGEIKDSFPDVKESMGKQISGIGSKVLSGDIVGLYKSFTIAGFKDEEGKLDAGKTLVGVFGGVLAPILAVPTTLIAVVKKVGPVLNDVGAALKSAWPNFKSNMGIMIDTMKSGDIMGHLKGIGFKDSETGELDLGKTIASITRVAISPFTSIPTFVVGAVKTIGKGIMAIGTGIKEAGISAIEGFKNTGKAITSGDIIGLVKATSMVNEDTDKIDIGRVISGGITAAIFPFAAIPTLAIGAFNVIKQGVIDIFEGFNKGKNAIADMKDMWEEMFEYTDLEKHPTMDGFDRIGTTSKDGDSLVNSNNNMLTGLVMGIGKMIVGVVRTINSAGYYIDKIPGVKQVKNLLGDGEGSGKYGTGRVSQIDPTVSNLPYNSPSDSTKQTIGSSGCGPAAAVNAINYAYGGASLVDASNYAVRGGWKERDGGTKPGFFSSYLSNNGVSANRIGTSGVIDSVNSGNPVILMGTDRYGGRNTPYGPNPHYVVAKGTDGKGNIIIDDPESINPSMAYPARKVLSKSSMAIRASRAKYGTGSTMAVTKVYNTDESTASISPYVNINTSDLYRTAGEAGTDAVKVIVTYEEGSETYTLTKYMKKSDVINKIGYNPTAWSGWVNPITFNSKTRGVTGGTPQSTTHNRAEMLGLSSLNANAKSVYETDPLGLWYVGDAPVMGDGRFNIDSNSTVAKNMSGNLSIDPLGSFYVSEVPMADGNKIQLPGFNIPLGTTNDSDTTSTGYKYDPDAPVAKWTGGFQVYGKIKVKLGDTYRIAFATMNWWDSPVSEMYSAAGAGESYFRGFLSAYKIYLTEAELSSTVKSIITKYAKFNGFDSLKTFVNKISNYTSLTVAELKKKEPSLYSELNMYYKAMYTTNISSTNEKLSVSSICTSIGITFKPEASVYGDDTGSSSSDINSMYGDSYGTEETTQKETIWDKIKNAFHNLFNYTDKDGTTKNALEVFGLASLGDSGSSSSLYSGSAVAGLSEQQSKVKSAMQSIMGKNYYDQNRRTLVGATLEGASMGYGDCSSTVQWALNKAGADPGSSTHVQIQSESGKWVDGPYSFSAAGGATPNAGNLALGDLMFYGKSSSGHHNNVSHVEMYWGNNQRVGHGGDMGPKVSDYRSKASSQRYLGAKRFITVGGVSGSIGSLAGGTPEQNKLTIWKFLKSKGYSDIAAAGIMGNIERECSFNHALTEDGGTGIGICQWTWPSRRSAFLAAVPDWETNLGGQLDFMWNEINSGYRKVLPSAMNQCSSIKDAVYLFHDVYEQSNDIKYNGNLDKREAFANAIYSQLANTGYGSTTYSADEDASTYGLGKHGLGSIIKNGYVSSGFNDPTRASHKGIDIASPSGNAVKSPVSGTVVRAEENRENGKMVVVKDDSGRLYSFSHLQSYNVGVGSRVGSGSIIGRVGSTGDSSGNHLHYQLSNPNGEILDPITGKSDRVRPIGGGGGTDYTSILNSLLQLLAIIATNTEKINALVEAMSALGIDTSNIDTTSNEGKIKSIQNSIKTSKDRFDQVQAINTELSSQRLSKLTSVMRTIAAQ